MNTTTKKFAAVGRAYKTRAGAENYLARNWTCDPEDFEGYVSEQPDGTFQAFIYQIPFDRSKASSLFSFSKEVSA